MSFFPVDSTGSTPQNFKLHKVIMASDNTFWGIGNQNQSSSLGPPEFDGHVFRMDTNLNVLNVYKLILDPNPYTNYIQFSDFILVDSSFFVATGIINDDVTGVHSFVLAFDNNGQIIWQYDLGIATSPEISCVELENSIVIVSAGDKIIHKLSKAGQLLISKSYIQNFYYTNISKYKEGLILCGLGPVGGFISYFDTLINPIWGKSVHGLQTIIPQEIKLTNNGEILMTYSTGNDITSAHAAGIIRIDTSGSVLWNLKFVNENTPQNILKPKAIYEMPNGNILLAGTGGHEVSVTSYSGPYANPIVVMEINSIGSVLNTWAYRDLYNNGNCIKEGVSIVSDIFSLKNRNYIFAHTQSTCGNTTRDQHPFIISTDFLKQTCFDSTWTSLDSSVTTNSGYQLLNVNNSNDSLGISNFYFENKSSIAVDLCSILSAENQQNNDNIVIHPNPSQGYINITGLNEAKMLQLHVYDASGRIVAYKSINQNNQVDLTHLINGMYVIEILSSGKIINRSQLILSK